jgi:hypothetical protein
MAVRTATLLAAFVGLIAFDGWSIYVAAWAAFVNRGSGSDPAIFWPAVGLNITLLIAGLWLTMKVWRRVRPRSANRLVNPS